MNFTIIKNKLLLTLGFKLVNKHGYTVHLKDGVQIKSNPHRTRDYSMDDSSWQLCKK